MTWTALDSDNSTATDTQLVTVRDTTPPAFSVVQNIYMDLPSNAATVTVNYDLPTATDLVDGPASVSCSPASGSDFAAGETYVTCVAVDESDNAGQVAFLVDVSVPVSGAFPFLDDFEDGNLDGWDVPEFDLTWRAGTLDEPPVPPGHPDANMVAEADACYTECSMTLSDGIDLTGQGNATLQFYRYLDDSLDSGEYLKVEAYDGTGWTQVGHMDARGL